MLWPGGVKNRLYMRRPLKEHTLPEIPCSYDGDYGHPGEYFDCVATSLTTYLSEGVIKRGEFFRLFTSAIIAFNKEQN